MIEDSTDVRHARIAWRCRRGMRELDLLLQKFLAPGLESLADEDLERLEHLLVQPDQDILAWLVGSGDPQDPELHGIVNIMRGRIRSHSKPDE